MLPAAPLLALALAASPIGCDGGAAFSGLPTSRLPSSDSLLTALYDRGTPWPAFLDGVRARRETWTDNYHNAAVDSALVARLERLPGRWRFLVIAEDWCGDSANTIPYLARLVEAAPQLDLRVINSTDGRSVMEAHPTEDGRAATPTVVLLDEAGSEQGCWVERPYALREVLAELRAGTRDGGRVETITAWRREDRGRSTLSDLVALLEAAASGVARCP